MIFFPAFPLLAALLYPIAVLISPVTGGLSQWRYERHYARQVREHEAALTAKEFLTCFA